MTVPVPRTTTSRVLSAAAHAEIMASELKDIVTTMREHPRDIAEAYRLLYDFRTRLGSQIAKLGVGKPSARKDYPIDGNLRFNTAAGVPVPGQGVAGLPAAPRGVPHEAQGRSALWFIIRHHI